VCGEFADVALSITHDVCGHRSHADCLSEPYDFDNCPVCVGGVASDASSWPSITSPKKPEPRTTDGVNYVLNPGVKKPASTILKVAAWVPVLGARVAETVENSRNPEFLLQHHVPLRTIMDRNGMGLDHFLKAGVVLEDFLKNGYTWPDLLQFEDISGKRGASKLPLQAITIGLQATANHFRTYADAFPYEAVRAHTRFEPVELGELFGLYFPDGGAPLQCEGNADWGARDCVDMGLDMDDLVGLGLEYREQYQSLMMGLNARDVAAMEKKLGVKKEHLSALVEPEVVSKPVSRPAVVKQQVQAPVQTIDCNDGSDYSGSEDEEEAPVHTVRKMAAPVVQARVHRTPRPKSTEAATTTAAAPLTGARRFDRHGALLVTK
jgi:hypothetical protein